MKVLLVLPDLGSVPNIFTGIASIAGNVKAKGHDVRLLHLNDDLGLKYDINEILDRISFYDPSIIGFSSSTIHSHLVFRIANQIKDMMPTIPIIYGGPHASIAAEKILKTELIDFVCIGEGEIAFTEFLDRLENGGDVYSVMNIWAKKKNQIVKNPLRPLVKHLEELAFPYYEIFDVEQILKVRNGWFDLVNIRGCPYNCSYCQTPRMRRMYRKEKATTGGWYIQKWKTDIFIKYLESLLQKVDGIKVFNFVDDMFLSDKEYAKAFCEAFKERIYKPYDVKMNVHATIDTITDEMLDYLQESGTRVIKMGIETGNEYLRKKILRKKFSNYTIKRVFEIMHKRKESIETWAFNMIGIPGETKQSLQDTFDLLASIKPDNVWFSIYYPLPQTDLYDECIRNNLIIWDKFDYLTSYREESILNLPEFKDGEIGRIYKTFNWYLNRSLHPEDEMIKKLINDIKSNDFDWNDSDYVNEFIEQGNSKIRKKYFNLKKDYFDPRWIYISLYNDWKDNTETKKNLMEYLFKNSTLNFEP